VDVETVLASFHEAGLAERLEVPRGIPHRESVSSASDSTVRADCARRSRISMR
jgi:hypothetical protein